MGSKELSHDLRENKYEVIPLMTLDPGPGSLQGFRTVPRPFSKSLDTFRPC